MLLPEYRQKGNLDVVWCGPYKFLKLLKKGESVKLDIRLSLRTMIGCTLLDVRTKLDPQAKASHTSARRSRPFHRSPRSWSKLTLERAEVGWEVRIPRPVVLRVERRSASCCWSCSGG